MLVIPIAFVSDHIETLHELNIEERHTAETAGIKNFRVMKGLNDHPLFIECLADIALKEFTRSNTNDRYSTFHGRYCSRRGRY